MSRRHPLIHLSRFSVLLWLCLFALIPLVMMFGMSFLRATRDALFSWQFSLSNYTHLVDSLYGKILLQSIFYAFITTFVCLVLGYPVAYWIARMDKRWQSLSLLLLVIPFWTSVLIRTYAIMTIIKAKGLLNSLLLYLGITNKPLQMLYTDGAVIVGLVYTLLPFMIMPLYANLEKFDFQLLEAAADLGASRWRRFSRVIFPQSLTGIVSGVALVFLPAMTLFYVPVLLGGARSLMVGNLIESQILMMHNWPAGAATSVLLTIFMLLLMFGYRLCASRRKGFGGWG